MNLKARVYVENQKKVAQAKLEARMALLKEKGRDLVTMQRDAALRKFKAEIKKADFRLASIEAQEKLTRALVQAKAEKLAGKEAQSTPGEASKAAPERKEKKRKQEGPAPSEPKKRRKRKKKERKQKEQGKRSSEELHRSYFFFELRTSNSS